MRTLKRAFAVACASSLAVPLWASPAGAETLSETASSVAYFSSTGLRAPDSSPNPFPNLISDSDVDGVGAGNLGVAADGGQESKVSFVYFSLSSLPFDATITRAVMTVPLAPEDGANRRVNAAPKNVRACAPDDTGFGGQDGQPIEGREDPTGNGLGYQGAPARLCDQFQVTATDGGDAYVFDLSALAATWTTANDGVALTRTADSDPSFQVVFTPGATLALEYTAPLEEELPLPEPTVDIAPVTPVDSGTSFDAGSFGGTSDVPALDTGVVAAPLTGGALPGAPAPETAEQPAVAAQRASLGGPVEVLSPTPVFWLAALLLAGGLVFLSLVLGDNRAVAAAASRPTRLSRALSGGGASALLTRTP